MQTERQLELWGNRIFACLLLTVVSALSAVAQSGNVPAPLPVTGIVSRLAAMNQQRAQRLRGFVGTRKYAVEYRGFPGDRRASMVVRVNYEAPEKKFTIVSEEGSKLLLNRVLHKLLESEQEAQGETNLQKTALTESNYDFSLLGTDTVDDRACYVLEVKPKRNEKFLYKGKIWVDASDFAVAQIQARPAKNPSFWISRTSIEHRYLKSGEFWLPASNRSTTKVRLGGQAVLTIEYQDYQITGAD